MQPAQEIVAEDHRRRAAKRVAQRPEVVDERINVAQNETIAEIDRLDPIELKCVDLAGAAADVKGAAASMFAGNEIDAKFSHRVAVERNRLL